MNDRKRPANPTQEPDMLEGPQVFVDIDTQRDFMEPDGALFVPGATEIVFNLERLLQFARDHAIPVLATACDHTSEDAELDRFPPHCMAGTPGAERIASTRSESTYLIRPGEPLPNDLPLHVTLLKRELDFFSHPLSNELIERLGSANPTFVVFGVATDYCVNAAVEGLLERGCRIAIVADAIRPIDREIEAEILSDFVRRGVLLTLTDIICNPVRRVPAPA